MFHWLKEKFIYNKKVIVSGRFGSKRLWLLLFYYLLKLSNHKHLILQSVSRNSNSCHLSLLELRQTLQHKYKRLVPANAWVKSSIVGWGLFLSRVYMDITIPGVQKPHCEPWALAIRSCERTHHPTAEMINQDDDEWVKQTGPKLTCTGWILVLVLPMPSTVVTAAPWSWQIGSRQALAE